MKTRERKEREFQQRESVFLDLARRLIAESGLAVFNMDRLAEATEYSKGTVYQHFASKEDLLMALAVQSLERRVAWFERATRLAGRPRERMYAITAAEEIFVTLRPLHFRSELMIKMDNFSDRASPERRAGLEQLEDRCFALVRGIVDDGVRSSDLVLPSHRTPGNVVAGFIAIHIGTFTIMRDFARLLQVAIGGDPLLALRDQIVTYLDGLGWRPLSTESDPAPTFRRVFQEVFPDESQRSGRIN